MSNQKTEMKFNKLSDNMNINLINGLKLYISLIIFFFNNSLILIMEKNHKTG